MGATNMGGGGCIVAQADERGRPNLQQPRINSFGEQGLWCGPSGQAARAGHDDCNQLISHPDKQSYGCIAHCLANRLDHALRASRVFHFCWIDRARDQHTKRLALLQIAGSSEQLRGPAVRLVIAAEQRI